MTGSLINNDEKIDDLSSLLDKQANGFAIEAIVAEGELGYLQATSQWLEENSIPEGNFNRFIPSTIIEKIKAEAVNEYMLRPSMSKTQKTNTLDFLL